MIRVESCLLNAKRSSAFRRIDIGYCCYHLRVLAPNPPRRRHDLIIGLSERCLILSTGRRLFSSSPRRARTHGGFRLFDSLIFARMPVKGCLQQLVIFRQHRSARRAPNPPARPSTQGLKGFSQAGIWNRQPPLSIREESMRFSPFPACHVHRLSKCPFPMPSLLDATVTCGRNVQSAFCHSNAHEFSSLL